MLAEIFGADGTIEFEGMHIVVGPPNQAEQGRFSRLLEARARAFAARADDDAERAAYQAVAVRDSASYQFDWGSEAYTAALGTPAGLIDMYAIVLPRLNPTLPITRDLVQRLVCQKVVEIAAVLRAEEEGDTAKKAAVLAAAGLPANYLESRRGGSAASSPPGSPSTTSPG